MTASVSSASTRYSPNKSSELSAFCSTFLSTDCSFCSAPLVVGASIAFSVAALPDDKLRMYSSLSLSLPSACAISFADTFLMFSLNTLFVYSVMDSPSDSRQLLHTRTPSLISKSRVIVKNPIFLPHVAHAFFIPALSF